MGHGRSYRNLYEVKGKFVKVLTEYKRSEGNFCPQ